MSANKVYQHHPTSTLQINDSTTRIPIASTLPVRQWGSLKTTNSECGSNNHNRSCSKREAKRNLNASPGLQRGHSFMELGERNRMSVAESRRSTAATGTPNRTTKGAPQTPTRIRSLSLSLTNAACSRLNSPKSPTVATLPKTPPTTPDNRLLSTQDWDSESVISNTSGISVASCDHASIARNGTTFSGRSNRFVVHCSEYSGATGDYLTPTQRAHQQVKRLKQLLHQAQTNLDSKDSDILRLTKEVVELRLYKAALGSPEDKSTSSNSGDIVTVVENHEEAVDVDGLDNQNSSCADSGHYDDLSNSREDIGYSPCKSKADKAITADLGPHKNQSEQEKLIVEYERRLQELVRSHEDECHQMKQRHNDKVEELLQRLSEVNARYWELVPDLDAARERIRELEHQLDEACKKLEEQERRCKEENERNIQVVPLTATQPDVAANTSRISVPDLLHQLEVTQNELENIKAMYRQLLEARNKNKVDPEITLQFLKSAIYYFLTDKENNQGHLRAIQNILGFSPAEISNIDKARMT